MDPILDHPIISARYFFRRPSATPNGTAVEGDGARLVHDPVELCDDPMRRGTTPRLVRLLSVAAKCTLVLVALSVVASCNESRDSHLDHQETDATEPAEEETGLVSGGECEGDTPMIDCESAQVCTCSDGFWNCAVPQLDDELFERWRCSSSEYCSTTFRGDGELICGVRWTMASYFDDGFCDCANHREYGRGLANYVPIA